MAVRPVVAARLAVNSHHNPRFDESHDSSVTPTLKLIPGMRCCLNLGGFLVYRPRRLCLDPND